MIDAFQDHIRRRPVTPYAEGGGPVATETAPTLRTGWLAGYPRSGAALVRTILYHCFGQGTASSYQEGHLGDAYRAGVGLCSVPEGPASEAAIARRQPVLMIKTHERPENLHGPGPLPVILIVRDGRRTLESLRAFYAENNGLEFSMKALIMGAHPWGDWSEWHRAWAAWTDQPVRWIRYEDIMANQDWAIGQLGAWLHVSPKAWEIPSFESLHKGTSTIFRKAVVTGNGGMTVDEEKLFWDRHGPVMSMVGYRR